MGICSNCKTKILYNKFKRYRGKILCYKCYDTRQERKIAKRSKKVIEPTKTAKKAMENNGITIPELYGGEVNEETVESKEENKTEDSS